MGWWVALLLMQQPQILDLPAVSSNPYTAESDVARGKELFEGRCAGCHGPRGEGGKGANLAVPSLPRASEDRALYRIIRYGIPDTEMPSSLMSTKEIWQVAAFVRSLGRIKREPVSGDASRGRQLVSGKGGCLRCHAIGPEGGRMGPPLTDIGARRGASHLRNKLLEPASDLPDQFRLVELTTAAGRAISGIRLEEDTFSIQIRDFNDNLHSFWKSELTSLKLVRRTPMPSYRSRLSEQELNDVVAYLTTLGGSQ